MIAVVTPVEMAAIDASAPEPLEVLIERAGRAVARAAIDMLGGTYGRVVNVVAGKGNNGADGRVAARRLQARGIKVRMIDASMRPPILPRCDLVIDAAYGTGFRGDWIAPEIGDALVLAVDIPSGVDALTGAAPAGVLAADRTVTFQAFKPGLLLGAGARLAGHVDVVDIGLDVSAASQHCIDATDVARWWPTRPVDAHKWKSAVKVVGGSPEMPGAAVLAATAAARAGGSLVSLSSPGVDAITPPEIVQRHVEAADFSIDALSDIHRFGALVIGPGLGRTDEVLLSTRSCISDATVPVVIDGDALFASAWSADGPAPLLRDRELATVLTPHDGEFGVLTGSRPGADRVASVRAAAADLGCTVLLKGPTTLVAAPPASGGDPLGGQVWFVVNGDQRLATAGSGDVLAGMIGAALAAGLEPDHAAAAAAWLHADAANRSPSDGLLAGDIVDALPAAIGNLR